MDGHKFCMFGREKTVHVVHEPLVTDCEKRSRHMSAACLEERKLSGHKLEKRRGNFKRKTDRMVTTHETLVSDLRAALLLFFFEK